MYKYRDKEIDKWEDRISWEAQTILDISGFLILRLANTFWIVVTNMKYPFKTLKIYRNE